MSVHSFTRMHLFRYRHRDHLRDRLPTNREMARCSPAKQPPVDLRTQTLSFSFSDIVTETFHKGYSALPRPHFKQLFEEHSKAFLESLMVTGYGVELLHTLNEVFLKRWERAKGYGKEKEKRAYGVVFSSDMYSKERPFATNRTRGPRTQRFLKQLS